jgi:DNA-binding NtrC family response regulator/ABC-type nitrate/sulfonate/bicarbonate transport system substrate-binding protein
MVFEDPLSHELLRSLEQVAPTEATVLVTGETGTGKEIVARHVHDRSRRAQAPFIAVNCGALTPSLMESELFGHEKAAFTGAVAAKAGWFEAANGGTLFLDEIADLALAAQVKLLRVLQEREVVRIGARRPIPIDVRLIAATNANLAQAVTEGRFREDLFYRLHVAHLTLAPLRDRQGDILPLAKYFLATYSARLSLGAVELSEAASARLLAHRWPGNIRELENALHRALLVKTGARIEADDLRLLAESPARATASIAAFSQESPAAGARGLEASRVEADPPEQALVKALQALLEEEKPHLLSRIEEALYRTAFEFSDNNQLRTARLLGTSRNVVRARLLQHGLIAGTPRESEPPPSLSTLVIADAGAESRLHASPQRSHRVRIGHQAFGVLSLLKGTRALEESLAVHRLEVQWVRYPTGMHVADALAVGAIDLAVVGEVPPIFAQAAHAPLVYLASEPPAPRGEAIVTLESSPVQKVADLRGARVAVARGSNSFYLARHAFLRGEVAAWALWDPLLSSVRQEGARVLRDATGLAHNRALYVARRGYADENSAVVDAFLGQVAALGRWIHANRRAAADALALHADVPAEALHCALAATSFDVGPMKADVLAAQQRIADALHRHGFIARPVRVGDAVWTPPGAERRSA